VDKNLVIVFFTSREDKRYLIIICINKSHSKRGTHGKNKVNALTTIPKGDRQTKENEVKLHHKKKI